MKGVIIICRKTWTKEDFHITYGKPVIHPYNDRKIITDFNEVMYFYYDINILIHNKVIFSSSAYDFPKVQNLPEIINQIINMKEEDMYLYEDIKHNGFERKKLFSFIDLEDSMQFDCEYFYTIKKIITYVKQKNESEFNRFEEYILSIGQCSPNKKGYSNGESYGKKVFIKDLEKEDLLRLKQTALDFCNGAIESYNLNLATRKIKCPKCNKEIPLLNSFVKTDTFDNDYYLCEECGEDFTY